MKTTTAGRGCLPGIVLTLVLGGCSSSSPGGGPSCSQSSALTPRVCASGPVIQGVDVSKYDAKVDWAQVKAAGIQFGFARISDGTANPDAYFTANWQGMKAHGIVRGAYQYFRASVDPTAQANLVASSLGSAGGLQAGDLPVVMDVETADGQSEAAIEAHMRTWLAAVTAKTGRVPIIYTSVGTYPVTSSAFATYPLWVANYGVSCPALPAGWSHWQFWQHASTGSVTGIGNGNVDLDEFDGTLAQLMTYGGAAGSDSGAPGLSDGGQPGDAGSGLDAGGGVPEGGAIHDSGPSIDGSGGNNAGAAMGQAGNVFPLPDASTTPCRP